VHHRVGLSAAFAAVSGRSDVVLALAQPVHHWVGLGAALGAVSRSDDVVLALAAAADRAGSVSAAASTVIANGRAEVVIHC
jgi:hypothetical protein